MDPVTRRLRDRFLERLLAEEPDSVLDAGAGRGELLVALRARAVDAVGLEPDGERATALARAGLAVVRASILALPFPDGAFGWVAVRHVLHHLRDPRRALAEVSRVAGQGLILAEPWRDPGLPGQVSGCRLDAWLQGRERRLGRDHYPALPPAELLALLRGAGTFDVELVWFLELAPSSPARLEARIVPLLEGLGPEDPERREGQELLAQAARGEIPATGSVVLVARRRRPQGPGDPRARR